MIEIKNISFSVNSEDTAIKQIICEKLGVEIRQIVDYKYLRKSIDARKRSDVRFCANIGVTMEKGLAETDIVSRCNDSSVSIFVPYKDRKVKKVRHEVSPVVCGAGPAGLFAALWLSRAGLKPIVIERGADADTRIRKIESFNNGGQLDVKANVQFGEGGAGTFSDGKLTTNIHDERCEAVLNTFYQCGAPQEILYLAKPHLGTDNLCNIVKNLRKEIINNGGKVRFFTKLTDVQTDNGKICGVVVQNDNDEFEIIKTDRLVVATGHSARDVFELLQKHNVIMEQKPFSIGVRIEHLQEKINKAQYGDFAKYLGAADYKMACHLPNGRSVYTFCMCPGGKVVAAASEEGRLVVNGMSVFARNGKNANSAVLCNVEPEDFHSDDVLAGVDFQQKYEELAYKVGGCNYCAPAQLVGDFLKDRPSKGALEVKPSYPRGVRWCKLSDCLPAFAVSAIKEALVVFGRKLRGFDDKQAVLTGVETRSSSPVRVKRNDKYQSLNLQGLYPCGEGAGYAGGITSAAVDGIRVAEAIIDELAEGDSNSDFLYNI